MFIVAVPILAAPVAGPVLGALSAQSVPLEGAPWQINAVLIGVPTTLGALTALVYALRGTRDRDSGPPDPDTADPAPTATLVAVPQGPMPTTVDGKLEYAAKYVAMLERSEAELTAKAAHFEALADQLRLQADQLREQADWFRERLHEQVEANRFLRTLLDRQSPGPPPAPPPSPPPPPVTPPST